MKIIINSSHCVHIAANIGREDNCSLKLLNVSQAPCETAGSFAMKLSMLI